MELLIGKKIRFKSINFSKRYLCHSEFRIRIEEEKGNEEQLRLDSTFMIIPGLSGKGISFSSENYPTRFIRHEKFKCYLHPFENTDIFKQDATWLSHEGLADSSGSNISFRSYNYPKRFMRHEKFALNIDKKDGSTQMNEDATFTFEIVDEDAKMGNLLTLLIGQNIDTTSSWMHQMIATIGTKTLRDISIPGSHDAGMSISKKGTLGANNCNTKTQRQDILGQLNSGSRYFDIRPIIGSGKYHTGHYGLVADKGMGARGQSIADIITDINTFTASNKELIILNLSHDMDTDNGYVSFTKAQWHSLFEQLGTIKDLHKVDDFPDLTNIEMNTFISDKSCVLIIADTNLETIGPYKYKGFFPVSSLNPYNVYANSNDVNHMADDQIGKMKTQRESGNYFLLSWTLTQDKAQVLACANPIKILSGLLGGKATSILDLAATANGKLLEKVLPTLTPEIYPNIIYTDDVGANDSTALSIYINKYIIG